MKKYLLTASLFLANIEIISWVVALVLLAMAVYDFANAAAREAKER